MYEKSDNQHQQCACMGELIKIFLSDGSGYGSGYGSGSGSGSGSGYGSGDGDGDGVKEYNGRRVYFIDGLPTVIYRVHVEDAANGYVVGRIVKCDLTAEPTYVVKREYKFAHGRTLAEAVEAVNAKIMAARSTEERIEAFVEAYPLIDTFVKGAELFRWHNILTGSCEQGRKAFCESKGLDLNHEYTIAQFITMTIDAYGGNVIKQLKERYERIG